MKKAFAIFLLAVYSFNLVGYSFVFQYLIKSSTRHLASRLDAHHYSEEELLTIRVPINLPYSMDMQEYERVDGQVEVNGIHYNYVKRRVFHDTLYLLCIPNHQATQLEQSRVAYGQFANGLSGEKQDNNQASKKVIILQEYLPVSDVHRFREPSYPNHAFAAAASASLPSVDISPSLQPPEVLPIQHHG